jgi:hypothetical protein
MIVSEDIERLARVINAHGRNATKKNLNAVLGHLSSAGVEAVADRADKITHQGIVNMCALMGVCGLAAAFAGQTPMRKKLGLA